ncbi:DUF2795 domain-containing protein [Microbacterium azadirachtae]|jgi:hypothetical protein|uniref:DUF2795 domain-containing protein n=1 Tax=Microbacterium azadirachtae TaxID=582680 RepID=UPI00088B1A89|nr:DUF2795 domain-containing protein [Microbacterium azadirachtae]UXW85424.1 DUF2795 domain-containing protein [Microbacterium azadirachtae]SDM15127.1 Protein of unknown function [Microbacterium azadirachtae]SEG38795.1 Protein of unknown function [Microbacterium azadirachtae]SEG41816.1 Protein of unknown function [Microbacterium azadirachtae]
MVLPSTLDRFLAGMEYPASRDDLMREALHDGLARADRDLLGTLPDGTYTARWHVRHALTRAGSAFDRIPALA